MAESVRFLNNMSRKEKALNNATFSFVNIVITKVYPFFLRTLLLYVLGTKYLGINNFFHSIISILSMADLGFGSALSYELYKPIAEKDDKKVAEIYKLYRKIYRIVGLIILFVGISLIPFLDYLINDTYPDGINISIIYLIYLLETVCYYLFYTEDQALLSALQRSDIQNKIFSISNICVFSLRAIVLVVFKNYYLFILFLPIGAFINRFILHYISSKKFPQYHVEVENSRDIFISIKNNTKDVTIQRVFSTLSSSVSSIFISRNIGLNMVTMYSNYSYISNSLSTIISSIVTSVTPTIGNSIVLDNKNENKKHFDLITFICFWIASWSTTCLFCLYQRFMIVWMGKNLLLDTFFVVLICISYFISISCLSLNVITGANGMWSNEKWRIIVTCSISMILQFILVKKLGVIGIVLASVISSVVVGYPWLITYVFRNYFQMKSSSYIYDLIKNTLITVLSIILSEIICNKIPFTGAIGLIICGIPSFVIPNLIYIIFSIKNEELFIFYKIIYHYVMKIVNKIKKVSFIN